MAATEDATADLTGEDARALACRGKVLFRRSMSMSEPNCAENEEPISSTSTTREKDDEEVEDEGHSHNATGKRTSVLTRIVKSLRVIRKKSTKPDGDDEDSLIGYSDEMIKIDSVIRDETLRASLLHSLQNVPGEWEKMISFVAHMQRLHHHSDESDIRAIVTKFIQADSKEEITTMLTDEVRMGLWAMNVPLHDIKILLWEAKRQIVEKFFLDNVVYLRLCLV